MNTDTLLGREKLHLPYANLDGWRNRHPTSFKRHPDFYVDFKDEGSMKINPFSWSNVRWLVVERDGDECRVCGSDGSTCKRVSERYMGGAYFTTGIEVQHIIPKSKGGSNHPENLITICRKCHLLTFSKGYGGVPRLDKKQTILTPSKEVKKDATA